MCVMPQFAAADLLWSRTAVAPACATASLVRGKASAAISHLDCILWERGEVLPQVRLVVRRRLELHGGGTQVRCQQFEHRRPDNGSRQEIQQGGAKCITRVD